MKVLIIGGGGREHAIAWRIRRDHPDCEIVSTPGNGGLESLGTVWKGLDVERGFAPLIDRVRRECIELVVVGPEAPLVAGLADALREAGVPTFGPGKSASLLEGSKAYAKAFMQRHGIPTARFRVVQDPRALDEALGDFSDGVVVKASGLAAGKGVAVVDDRTAARAIALSMLSGSSFGAAGQTVVLEERLSGVEMTMLVFVCGDRYLLLDSAQDYKTLLDGNRGPNTGGMGSYSPTHLFSVDVRSRILSEVLEPTLRGLKQEGIPYSGVLYLGLMLTQSGPMLLEYNVRFGDPEAQALLVRLDGDFLELLNSIATGRLDTSELRWKPCASVCVVMASAGYPGDYERGLEIRGPVLSAAQDPVQVFHAGTTSDGGRFRTAGGRVLAVTAIGETLTAARESAYARVREIQWDGIVYRRDVARHEGLE